MKRKAKVLIVDDTEMLLDSLKVWLESKGEYEVFAVSNADDALKLAATEWLHLAVIDVKLDPQYMDDRSGFDLAKKMWAEIPKVFLTALEDGDSSRNGLSPEMKEDAGVAGYVLKKAGEQALLQAIQKVLSRLNLDLEIQWGSHTPRMLIEMLKGYHDKEEKEKVAAAHELEDLFCKVFNHHKAIQIIELKRGKGGCAVGRITPTLSGGHGADVMVKFGPREKIIREWENYELWVKEYVPHGSTFVTEKPGRTLHLAAINYSFVGGAGIDGSFTNYFRTATPERLGELLDYLFKETCAKWYKAKPTEPSNLALDLLYRSSDSLNLSDSKHVGELEAIVEQMLDPATNLYRVNIQKSGEANLILNLGRFSHTLPNPLSVALRERFGFEAANKLFPAASQITITHGDLNGENILVSKDNKTFLIDFYKTGFSHIFRDFVVLESIIKFEMLQSSNLADRYELETALLKPRLFSDPISLDGVKRNEEFDKVVFAVQRLRHLAFDMSLSNDMYEYYVALLFYALREIVGFSSGVDEPKCCEIRQYHALLSAARICQKLIGMRADTASVATPIKIFLSYASEDEAEVQGIYDRLRSEGYSPWKAPQDIFPGETWLDSIERAVGEATFFLPIITEHSVDKRGIRQAEIKQALDLWRQKHPRDIYIIPTRLDTSNIPEDLARIQWVDLHRADGWERLMSAIREGLKRLGGKHTD